MRFIFPITQAGRRIRGIEKAIREERYVLANQLLRDFEREIDTKIYNEINHLPRWNKLNDLYNLSLNRTRTKDAIARYDVVEARKYLEELKEKVTSVKKTELNELEARINTITEEGLIARINKSEGKEKKELMEKFTEVYSASTQRTKIIEDLIVGRFSDLSNAPEQNASSDELYEIAHDVNRLLQKYSRENMDLGTIIYTGDLSGSINEYLKILKHKKVAKREVKNGELVRTVKTDTSFFTGWNQNYIEQRASVYRLGTIGKVIEFVSEGFIYVEFDKLSWKQNMDFLKGRPDNVAAYSIKELQPVEPANEIDKNHVRKELEVMKELFQEYYTAKPQEPVKKRHNPEITEQDRVLPRSD